jgi:hypothetical protein
MLRYIRIDAGVKAMSKAKAICQQAARRPDLPLGAWIQELTVFDLRIGREASDTHEEWHADAIDLVFLATQLRSLRLDVRHRCILTVACHLRVHSLRELILDVSKTREPRIITDSMFAINALTQLISLRLDGGNLQAVVSIEPAQAPELRLPSLRRLMFRGLLTGGLFGICIRAELPGLQDVVIRNMEDKLSPESLAQLPQFLVAHSHIRSLELEADHLVDSVIPFIKAPRLQPNSICTSMAADFIGRLPPSVEIVVLGDDYTDSLDALWEILERTLHGPPRTMTIHMPLAPLKPSPPVFADTTPFYWIPQASDPVNVDLAAFRTAALPYVRPLEKRGVLIRDHAGRTLRNYLG